MSRKEIAPTACPNCGEEKLWGSDTNPAHSPRKLAVFGISRLFLGYFPSLLIARKSKATMVYKCGKCGFTENYIED